MFTTVTSLLGPMPPYAAGCRVGASNTVVMATTHGQAAHCPTSKRGDRVAGVFAGGHSARPSRALSRQSRDSEVCLPPDVKRPLADVVTDGFIVYCCGPRAAPWALVGTAAWDVSVQACVGPADRVSGRSPRRFGRDLVGNLVG